MLLIVPRKSETGSELRSEPGDQQAMLVGCIVIHPNNFEPLPDTAIGYRGHDRRRRVINTSPADDFAARACAKDGSKLEPSPLDVLQRRQPYRRRGLRERRSNNRQKHRGNIGDRSIGGQRRGCAERHRLNPFKMAAVPQDSYDWRWYYARLQQQAAQAQNVGWMAEADIGDYRGHGPRSALLLVKPDRSTRAKAAECMSQCPASVWAIRNQNDRTVAGHSRCTGPIRPSGRQRDHTATIGGNSPIFGKALIVAAAGLALSGYDRCGPLASAA